MNDPEVKGATDTSSTAGPPASGGDPAAAPRIEAAGSAKPMTGDKLKEAIIASLRTCFDPEIPVNIYDLGLIYDLIIDGRTVWVRMTLTSVGCPTAPEILAAVDSKIRQLPGVGDVKVELTFEPAWSPEKVSESGKEELLILGVRI